jgi:hypothetical protein
MKKHFSLLLALAWTSLVPLGAQTLSIGTTATPAPPLIAPALSTQTAPPLNLALNETQRVFTVSVSNTGSAVMSVLGVQTTNGLYVVQLPTTIPAHGSAVFTLLYYSKTGVATTSDLLRVLTDQGEVDVSVDHARAPAIQFSSTSLQWQQGEASSAKSVTFTISGGAAVPDSVTALGSGNSAQVSSLGNGNYQLTVTPGSTAKPLSFPVMINLQPALPDVVPVVTCTIAPN